MDKFNEYVIVISVKVPLLHAKYIQFSFFFKKDIFHILK